MGNSRQRPFKHYACQPFDSLSSRTPIATSTVTATTRRFMRCSSMRVTTPILPLAGSGCNADRNGSPEVPYRTRRASQRTAARRGWSSASTTVPVAASISSSACARRVGVLRPTAGWQAVQCESSRLTRVRGVPLIEAAGSRVDLLHTRLLPQGSGKFLQGDQYTSPSTNSGLS